MKNWFKKLILGFGIVLIGSGIIAQPTNIPIAKTTSVTYNPLTQQVNQQGLIIPNIRYPIKTSFTTNYTVTTNDTVLFCAGTNQFITLSGVIATTGKYISVYPVSSTASVIITNTSGVTIMGATSQTVTNGQHLTIISDGANWR